MSQLTRPAAGARYLLERERIDGARAHYRASVFLPEAEHAVTAILTEGGGVEITPTGAGGDHDETLAMFAKLLARGVAKRREDGLPPWPQRLLRWRGPGRGE